MEEVGRSKIWPSSLRLVDNVQFLTGTVAFSSDNKTRY